MNLEGVTEVKITPERLEELLRIEKKIETISDIDNQIHEREKKNNISERKRERLIAANQAITEERDKNWEDLKRIRKDIEESNKYKDDSKKLTEEAEVGKHIRHEIAEQDESPSKQKKSFRRGLVIGIWCGVAITYLAMSLCDILGNY